MKLLLKELMNRSVSEIGAAKRAVHCTPTMSVRGAVFALRKAQVGSIVVAEGGKIKGIFTERDFLEKVVFQGADMNAATVAEFMTPNPVCVKRHQSIGHVLMMMREGKFRHVIIVDAYDHLEKVVSIREIMNYLIESITEKAAA